MIAKFPEHETTDQCLYVDMFSWLLLLLLLLHLYYILSKFYTKALSVPLQEKGTYRSWWVDWETALWSGSVCWRGWGSGGGDTEAFLFLPRPRPTFRFKELNLSWSLFQEENIGGWSHPAILYICLSSPQPQWHPLHRTQGVIKAHQLFPWGKEFKCLFICFSATHQSEWRLDRPLATLSASIETVMHSSVTASFGPPVVMF